MSEKGFRSKRHKSDQYFGAKLRDAVETHEEKNWPTPTSTERSGINPETGKGEGLSKQAKNWATPNTMDYMPSRSYEAMKRQATSGGRKNRERPGNLREQIDPLMNQAYQDAKVENSKAKEQSWPTPQVGEEKASKPGGTQNQKMLSHVAIGLPDQDKSSTSGKSQESWPTMSMPQGGAALNNKRGKNAGHPLTTAVCMEKKAKTSMRLNPNWVEQLMGLPVGWTQLPTELID